MAGGELPNHRHAGRAGVLILSGQSSEETMLASVGPAHQFLAKPCDANRLKDTVRRACALRGLLDNVNLQRLLSQLGSLPSPISTSNWSPN